MARYVCRVADPAGKVAVERREAESEESLAREISAQGRFLISFKLEAESAAKGRSFPHKIVLDFTRTLAVLLQAGLSVENSIEIAKGAFGKGSAAALCSRLLEGLRRGESFSAVLGGFGSTFPAVYRGMVRIGERTGKLEPMFARISSYLDEQKKLSDKIRGALMYPSLVLAVVALMILGIVFFLVPGLRGLFGRMGSGLPPQTAAALDAMGILAWLVLALGVGLGAAVLGVKAARKGGGAFSVRLDAALLRLPLYGRYERLRESLSFAFAMEALVAAGITIEDALAESGLVLQNGAFRAEVGILREAIVGGGVLSEAFARCSTFTPEFARWAAVGERTGSVETIFAQTKSFLQYDLDRWTGRFMALIEPALIVVVGIILVTIVLLFIIPFLTSFTSLV